MKTPGQVVLFRFPHTDLGAGKLRPALLLNKLPGERDDWLICMISSQVHQGLPNFDETLTESDADFSQSGLKSASVIRISRLAVVEGNLLLGAIGQIDSIRLKRIKNHLADWLKQS